MTDLPPITGNLIATRRAELGLSRERFAQLVDMRPGALWRVEVRDVFKLGEREHLAAVADRWLTNDVSKIPQNLPRRLKTTTPKATTPTTFVTVKGTLNAFFEETDVDIIQWADVLKPDARRRLELVFPLNSVSPTTLSIFDGARRVSNSEVQTFKRCRRKWWLTYVRGLRSTYESPFGARATGTRGHAALAAYYRPDGEERMSPRDALEVIISTERDQLLALPDVTDEVMAKFNRDVELERVIIEGYVEWLSTTGADAEYVVIGSERYLEAELPEVPNTRIIARLDARVVRRYDNARLFIDHKFVASIPGAVRLLPLNEQMQWYVLLEELQSDRDSTQRVGGALYNMLRRCKRSATAKPPFYQRVEVHHSPVNIASFRRRLVGTLVDMQLRRDELTSGERSHQDVVYPTPTRDCLWDCPFLKICTMFDDGSRVEDAILDHYVVGDPYSYYRNPIERSNDDK